MRNEKLIVEHMDYAAHFALYVKAKLPVHVETDDLVGEAFLALVSSGMKFEPTRKLPFAGVVKIRIRGAVSDYLRKANPIMMDVLEDVHTVEHDFTQSVSKADRLVRSAMLEVSERERGILVLRHVHGLSHDAIGARMGLSYGRIWQLENRGKQQLRRALARRGIKQTADIL